MNGDRNEGAVVTRRIWALILVLVTAQPTFAADYFGQVTFNGLPVPGATVTATAQTPPGAGPSAPLGAATKASTTTNEDGIYHLADLAEGVWTLTIELFGFAPITREIVIPTTADPPPSS